MPWTRRVQLTDVGRLALGWATSGLALAIAASLFPGCRPAAVGLVLASPFLAGWLCVPGLVN